MMPNMMPMEGNVGGPQLSAADLQQLHKLSNYPPMPSSMQNLANGPANFNQQLQVPMMQGNMGQVNPMANFLGTGAPMMGGGEEAPVKKYKLVSEGLNPNFFF